ncbi:MAG: 30S ribosomal protein THX [Spirochaetales bacterium]|nr:30S ribosomal protein THX [Spirochaetales bacterium]
MGKGDRSSRKGKIWRGSFGKTRPHKIKKQKSPTAVKKQKQVTAKPKT